MSEAGWSDELKGAALTAAATIIATRAHVLAMRADPNDPKAATVLASQLNDSEGPVVDLAMKMLRRMDDAAASKAH